MIQAALFILLTGMVYGAPSFSAPMVPKMENIDSEIHPCEDLRSEIENLRRAQAHLMRTLVQKNDTLAETLDIFAQDIVGQKKSNKKTEVKKLKQTANSFRSHSVREQNLVNRFEALAENLYGRVNDCLPPDSSTEIQSTAQ